MNNKKIVKKLKKYKKEGKFFSLLSKYDDNYTSAIVLDVNDDFVVLQEFFEFKDITKSILPISSIQSLRRNKNDKYHQTILEGEGLIKIEEKVKNSFQMDISSWKSISRTLKVSKITIIIDCERSKDDFFGIGEVKNVNKDSVEIRYFDAQGVLDETNTRFPYEMITKLSFDSQYANIFSKYTREF